MLSSSQDDATSPQLEVHTNSPTVMKKVLVLGAMLDRLFLMILALSVFHNFDML